MDAQTDITLEPEDLTEAVRSTAMLADVTIGTWAAERTDRKMMEDIKNNAGAVGNVGRTIKNLLAGADATYKDARSAYAQVRVAHYALTLPWVSDPHATRVTGPRLLPNLLFDRYLKEISMAKRGAEAALDRFIDDYPTAAAKAQINLAGLASPSDYPSADRVRSAFRVSFDFDPIPAGTAFKGLPDSFLGKLSAGLQRKQERMVNAATAAMWKEARDRVGHMVERLAIPIADDKKFRTATVENVRELLTLLPAWNITRQPEVADVVSDIETMLLGVDVKDLRKDQRVRTDVVNDANAVLAKMNRWGL